MKTASRLILLSTVLLGLVGCSGISNVTPLDGTTVPTGPVAMRGEFRSNINNSLRIDLDGTDVTAQFNPVYNTAPGTFGATIGLTAGPHKLTVSGDFTTYFLFIPAGRSFQTKEVNFTVPGPTLTFSQNSVTATPGGTASVRVSLSQSQSGQVTVNLSAAPGSIITTPPSTTIAQGATDSPMFTITGAAVGDTVLTASANGFTSDTLDVAVNPTFTAIAPAMGPVGTPITLTGSGFVVGNTSVQFGNITAPTPTVVSANSLTTVVPAGLPLGNRAVTVTVAGNTSSALNFAVSAAPMPPATPAATLFRTSAQDVQTFTFTPASGSTPASLTLVESDNATAQGGVYTVSLAQTPTRLVRSSPADAQAFTIGTPLSVTLSSTRGGALSGTGSAIAISGTTVVRAIDSGIEVSVLNAAGSLGAFTSASGSPSATGVAVDILGSIVVRAHSGGIDLFDVSNPASPVRLNAPGTGSGDASAVGTGVRFINATRVVRTFPQGVEIYDVTNSAAPSRLTVNRTGFVDAAMGTAVAVEPGGAAVIRATSLGLERYPLPLAAATAPTHSANSRTSTTGVGVVVVGTRAFRATNDRLEVYNLPALGVPVTDIAATVSAVGVGLTGR
jgi:hypothetical protein